jgi:tRNA G18 (ribose-2'-O)-methylase SpoU
MVEPQTKDAKPKGYMLMFNIQKAKNFGTIIRSAAAFNLSEIFLVEPPGRKNKIATFGSQGTANKMPTRFFSSTGDVRSFCTEQNIKICGIEIMPDSKPIQSQPFQGDTLFILGNEGSGLNSTQIAMCDHFVYIPQYTDKTASLNVAIAGSIIFHHFAMWA